MIGLFLEIPTINHHSLLVQIFKGSYLTRSNSYLPFLWLKCLLLCLITSTAFGKSSSQYLHLWQSWAFKSCSVLNFFLQSHLNGKQLCLFSLILLLKLSLQALQVKLWLWAMCSLIILYRVSHCKLYKVILLCWGYRFWFLLIFWILRVHEIGTFMPNSSVFIFLMFRAL